MTLVMSKKPRHVANSRDKDRYAVPTSSNGHFDSDATMREGGPNSLSQQQLQQRQTLGKRPLQNDDEEDEEDEEVDVVDDEDAR